MKFSQRIGINPVDTVLQVQGMNADLRNSLWNILDILIWKTNEFVMSQHGEGGIQDFSARLWFQYYKEPIDSRPDYGPDILEQIRGSYFSADWYEVYDFLEYVISIRKCPKLITGINKILERELSGYRYIESAFVPVTDEVEIEAVQKAVSEGPFSGVHSHLKTALEHLSRRENPDYRNSIKESISAVESMAREVTENPKATLGDALTLLEKRKQLHPALKKAFSAFYGYTSDEEGIRHAMLDEPDITISDAKFFLVACSSFINFLKVKLPSGA